MGSRKRSAQLLIRSLLETAATYDNRAVRSKILLYISRMVPFLVSMWVIFSLVINRCNCICGESGKVGSAKVKVANSTHLRVSWHDVFPGCDEVDHAYVVADEHKGSSKTFSVQFDEKEALVSLDPCLGYSIFLRLFFHDDMMSYLRESEIVQYNAMSPNPNISTVYGGLFEEVKFLQNICLKDEEGEISIPDPPEEVGKCVLNMDYVIEGVANETRQSNLIMMELVNPLTSREPLILLPYVENIKNCTAVSTDEKGDKIATHTISITVSVVCFIIFGGIVVFFTKKRCHQEKRPVKQETNADYGYYYSVAGDRLDEGTMEVTDQNPNYG